MRLILFSLMLTLSFLSCKKEVTNIEPEMEMEIPRIDITIKVGDEVWEGDRRENADGSFDYNFTNASQSSDCGAMKIGLDHVKMAPGIYSLTSYSFDIADNEVTIRGSHNCGDAIISSYWVRDDVTHELEILEISDQTFKGILSVTLYDELDNEGPHPDEITYDAVYFEP